MKYFSTSLIIFLILIIIGCTSEDKKSISNILEKRELAFENKDEELYSSYISDNYNVQMEEKTLGKEDVLKNFRSNVLAFDKIDFSHKDRSIYIDKSKAKVVQKTTVKLQLDDQSSNYKLTEFLQLENENGQWKIVKESDIDLFRGFVFGGN